MLAATPRLARHLAWVHHRERVRAGSGAWATPTIVHIDRWLESCWEHSLLGGGAAGRQQLLNPAQFHRAADLVTDRLEFDDVPQPGGGARRLLARAWTLTRDWGIGARELDAASANPDTAYFVAWMRRFRELCRERDWVDPASLAAMLLPEIVAASLPLADSIVLAGFERMTWQQQRLFEALNQLGRLAGRLDPDAQGDHSMSRSHAFADARAERAGVAQWARDRIERQADASLGVIVPDLPQRAGDFRRSFLDAFDPLWRQRDGAEFPLGIDDGATLADAGYVHTALLLLRVPDGVMNFRDFGQLLRSPYLSDESEAAARAHLDLRIRDGRMQDVDLRGLCRRHRDEQPQTLLAGLQRMLDAAPQLSTAREPAAWLPVIDSLLKSVGFGQGRTLSRDDERARDAWTMLLEQFGTLGDVVGAIRFDQARRLLADNARDRRLRSSVRPGGAQIMSPWEAAGHVFDAVWLCGMTSEAWPPAARPSPLIPLSVQRARGVPDAHPELFRAQALATVDKLLDHSRESVVSWPLRVGEQEQVASPRIARLPPVGSRPADETESQTNWRTDYRLAHLTDSTVTDEADVAPPLQQGERARGGARLVDLQSACPARAFFELRLGAREMRAPPYALDAAARGTLLHDAAEHLYAALRDAGGPASVGGADLQPLIAAAIAFTLDKNIPRRHPLGATLRENESRRQALILENLVEFDRGRGAFRIAELEGEHEIMVGGLPLNVRFDRVDEVADGARLVIDYKTGAHFSISKCRGERPLQLQLPLYAAYGSAAGIGLCWLHSERVRMDAIAMHDFGMSFAGAARKYLLDDAGWAALVGEWREIIESLAAEFAAGDARIDLEHERLASGQFAMLTRRWDIDHFARSEECE